MPSFNGGLHCLLHYDRTNRQVGRFEVAIRDLGARLEKRRLSSAHGIWPSKDMLKKMVDEFMRSTFSSAL